MYVFTATPVIDDAYTCACKWLHVCVPGCAGLWLHQGILWFW